MFCKKNPLRKTFFALLAVCAILTACEPSSSVFQQQEAIPETRWNSAFKPVFYFDISDSLATYNLFFLIRHTQAYPFSNIWLRFSIKGPQDTVGINQQIEIPLAQENGQWYGRNMNEIWEQRMPIATRKGPNILFPKPGRYKIQLEHLMRTNPLPEVMNIGLRVEKKGVLRNE